MGFNQGTTPGHIHNHLIIGGSAGTQSPYKLPRKVGRYPNFTVADAKQTKIPHLVPRQPPKEVLVGISRCVTHKDSTSRASTTSKGGIGWQTGDV